MAKLARNTDWTESVRERLRLFVDASGMSQKAIAAEIGLSSTRFSNYLTGIALIDIAAAIELRKRFNVPLEWLYMGDKSGLSLALFQRLYPDAK